MSVEFFEQNKTTKKTLNLFLVFVLWLPALVANSQDVPLNDPTRPLNVGVTTTGLNSKQKVTLVLSGIFKDHVGRVAVINGKAYRAGDSVESKTIKHISSNKVYWLEGESPLQLFPNIVKRTVSED